MRMNCPHCKDRARIRTTKRPSPVFYESYVECVNTACGWTGKVLVEFARTIVPSRSSNEDVKIPMDPRSREVLLAELTSA